MSVKIHGDNSASACGFATGDGDTGIMPGSDVVDVVTGGTSRIKAENAKTTISNNLEVDGSAIFNDAGNGVDFQVKSASNANMLLVDGSTNRVGIGTDAPATTLEVEGGQAELQVQSTSGTNSAGFRMIPGGQTNAVYMYADGNRNINFDDHATAMISIRAGGGGITFHGDTATANALDDYEEGTWTPTTTGATLTVNHARYRKIGSMVYVTCSLDVTVGSGNQAAHISGLPFSAESSTGNNYIATESRRVEEDPTIIYAIGYAASSIANKYVGRRFAGTQIQASYANSTATGQPIGSTSWQVNITGVRLVINGWYVAA